MDQRPETRRPEPHRPRSNHRAHLLAGLALAALVAAGPAMSQDRHRVAIAAGPLDAALLQLAAQTHEQLLFPQDLVAGRRAPALHAELTTEQALAQLLADTGITVSRAGPGVLVLRAAPARFQTLSTAPAADAPQATAPRPFAGEPSPAASPLGAPPLATGDAAPAAISTVSEVQVTGTHIRGASAGASPVVTIGHEDLIQAPQGTLAGVLDDLPQAFNNQNTEGTIGTRADRQGLNSTFATGVNLRGLGSNATLVLVDGKRIGGSGSNGNFGDVSTLPTLAVERVEVLLDGASAIYGSDAVGGVVNVILRRDVEGGEFRLRAGEATDGSPADQQAGVIFGHRWSSGGFTVAYEASHHSALTAADRSFASSADLRPFGGSDFRSTSAFPGNITGLNPATGVTGPFFGIPTGQAGVGLKPTSFLPGALNLTSPQQGTDLLPAQTVQTLFATIHQELGDRLEISADLRSGYRRERLLAFASTSTLTVTKADPFFVSPNGAASNTIAYSFIGELPNPINRTSAESDSASLAAHLRLDHGWAAAGYVSAAQEIDETKSNGTVNTAILAEALGNVPDRPNTAYNPAVDGFFDPYTGVASNSAAVLRAIGSGFGNTRSKTQVEAIDVQADGPLFALPGGSVKLAVGADLRHESFEIGGSSFTSTAVPSVSTHTVGDHTVGAVFAELAAPLVGPDNRLPGVEGLELSAAARYERYSDFGHTLNPKIGLTWTPVADVRVRASYGTSFRAPAFQELLLPALYNPITFPGPGGKNVLALVLQGGNSGLQPETATSWTAGIDYRPHFAPGLQLTADWFDIDFSNRIDRPLTQNLAAALTDPRFVDFRQFISPATNPADLTLINSLLANPAAAASQGLNPATAYGAIVQLRNVNTGSLVVRGLDVQASDRFDVAGGNLKLHANATYLLDYLQALTPTAPSFDLVGLATDPARLRARAGVDWTRGPFSVGGTVNFLSAFKDSVGAHIDSLTTLDLQARYVAPTGRFAGAAFVFTVRNLLNTDPPFYNNAFGFAFDPANADAIGRVVALQITKSW